MELCLLCTREVFVSSASIGKSVCGIKKGLTFCLQSSAYLHDKESKKQKQKLSLSVIQSREMRLKCTYSLILFITSLSLSDIWRF